MTIDNDHDSRNRQTAGVVAHALTEFDLPPDRVARTTPESRGLDRDAVRLLVATRGGIRHTRFSEFAGYLDPGDVVVVNTSAAPGDEPALFARHPGSQAFPSAARPFTPRVLVDLIASGVVVLPVVLHAGPSGDVPKPERFSVPAVTAEGVGAAKRRGSRVVAVGTTAVRALESAVYPLVGVRKKAGWTHRIVDRTEPVRVVTGLVTGWHPPRASHLSMLEAVAGPDLVAAAYDAALAHEYLWGGWGDSCLLLP